VCREQQNIGSPFQQKIHAKSFLSKLSIKRAVEFLKLNRIQARQVTGLLAGHLMGYLFKLGTTNNPICGRCHTTETASHLLCECEVLVKLRFHCLGKYFMKLSDHDKIPLCKLMYSMEVQGLLME
jgi:hypothetical protein